MSDNEPIPGMTPQEAIETKPQPTSISDTEQVKKTLVDPHTISKEFDPEGRSETARTVLEARTNEKTAQEKIAENEQKVKEIAELTSTSYLQERQKIKELAQRLANLVVKLKSTVGLGDKQTAALREEISVIGQERGALFAQSYAIEDELKSLKEKQTEIPNPKQLLEAYYEKVATQPLSNEQKRKLLKPEVLASLTEEEYIALWRRLNPYFLSHVTRQGFRDHNAMAYHEGGLDEFHDGFERVIEDGKMLRPPSALRGLANREESTVRQYLNSVLQAENETEARTIMDKLLHFTLAALPSYADKTAVHFAPQIVMDSYYGGEMGNEIFFVFPADVIASQYNYGFGPSGWSGDFTKPNSDTKWNDVLVWPQEVGNPGIPIDSGVVFLPETTPVDPETGSKYASEVRNVDGHERRVLIEDTELVDRFVEWGKSLDKQSPTIEAFHEYDQVRSSYLEQDGRRKCYAVFFDQLQKIGFTPGASASLGQELAKDFIVYGEKLSDEQLRSIIKTARVNLKRPQTTVSAKEYWENFFTRNPHLRPRHIHFYDGDPTTAIMKFQQQYNIGQADTSQSEGLILGFDDHRVMDLEKDPRANDGYDKLVAMADKIIEDHYGV